MPLHEEDMNRRRKKREAQRKKQQQEARRLKLTLALAGVILVVCGFGIFRMIGNRPVQEQPSREEVVQTKPTEAPKATAPTQQEPTTTIHIKAAGDLNVTDSVVDSGLAVGGYDYSPVFKDVASILTDADLTVMNFEGNLVGGKYGTESSSAPLELVKALRSSGVDMLQMANSCIINNGMIGMTTTLQAVRSAGIEPLGAYATEAEFRSGKGYTIADVQGIKVAFVAFTKGLGGRGLPAGSENLVNLLYEDYATEYKKEDKEGITAILKNVEAEKPDITIAMLHWGSEYNEDISASQKKLVSLMQQNGVDVILGTHPHTLQPIVYDPIKGTLVAYSLGDFFGDADRGATNYSIILDLEITRDNIAGTTKVTDYSYEPIYTVRKSESPDKQQRVVRIRKAMEAYEGNFLDKVTDECYAGMQKAMTRIPERMASDMEVTCPDCDKDVTVYVITNEEKKVVLVSDTKCKCGFVLEAGKLASSFD